MRDVKKPRRDCATCGHDVSLHQWDPAEQGRKGPGKCGNCVCKRFVRPAEGARRVKPNRKHRS